MKAAIFRSYGSPDVLKIENVEKPVPKDDEVLVKVFASSVNPAEWYAVTGLMITRIGSNLLKPKDSRLGVDYAGVVESVGKNVTQFKSGDEVFGSRSGAFAEYVCARNFVFAKPANLTFEQAGSVATAAITASQGLRDHGKMQAGHRILINGASGGVGTFTVQIAKALGAEVTAVCSTRNVEMTRSLGADHVIDYTQQDYTRCGKQFDVLLDIAGSRSWYDNRRVLTPQSTYVIVGAPKTNRWLGPLTFILRTRLAALGARQKVVFFIANFKREDFQFLADLFERGLVKPVVEKTYPLDQITDALHYLGSGHARGKIVITMP
ncbi:MAG: NAD(P)-dependent alcohol dehydrogenase [Bellilinea sp.]|jgi:NADPH:quinone reductase-like Zn-dependent oxidoreductase